MARNFSNVAVSTTLTAGVSDSATSLAVTAVTGYPSAPFTVILEPGTAFEELVEVTAVSGSNFTVSRGIDGSPAQPHGIGAVVVHGTSARDYSEPQAHAAATTNVHGVGGSSAVVGTTTTQTLTNKTLTSPTINSPAMSGGTWTSPTFASPTLTTPTLTSPTITGGTATSTTLVTPAIASFASATHDHTNAAGGGTLAAVSTGFYAGSTASSAGAQDYSGTSYVGMTGMSLTFTAPSTWPTNATKLQIHMSLVMSAVGTSTFDFGTSLLRLQLDGSTYTEANAWPVFYRTASTGSDYTVPLGHSYSWVVALPSAGSHTITAQFNADSWSVRTLNRQLWVSVV